MSEESVKGNQILSTSALFRSTQTAKRFFKCVCSSRETVHQSLQQMTDPACRDRKPSDNAPCPVFRHFSETE